MKTADQAYQTELTTTRGLLHLLTNALNEHSAVQAKHPLVWGCAGSLEHVNAQLAQALIVLLPDGSPARTTWENDEKLGLAMVRAAAEQVGLVTL